MSEIRKEKSTFNTLWIGIVSGVLAPILFFVVYCYSRLGATNDFIYVVKMVYATNRIVQLASISVFANLAVFMIYEKTNRLTAAKGVLTSTVALAVIVFVARLVS